MPKLKLPDGEVYDEEPEAGQQARGLILAATLLLLGIQIVFSSFLLSILGLRRD